MYGGISRRLQRLRERGARRAALKAPRQGSHKLKKSVSKMTLKELMATDEPTSAPEQRQYFSRWSRK